MNSIVGELLSDRVCGRMNALAVCLVLVPEVCLVKQSTLNFVEYYYPTQLSDGIQGMSFA